MEKNSKREFPEGFKRHLIDLFFTRLKDIQKIADLKEQFAQRGEGFNGETFYWMDPQLHPLTLREMREILENPEFPIPSEKRRDYLEMYKEFYRL